MTEGTFRTYVSDQFTTYQTRKSAIEKIHTDRTTEISIQEPCSQITKDLIIGSVGGLICLPWALAKPLLIWPVWYPLSCSFALFDQGRTTPCEAALGCLPKARIGSFDELPFAVRWGVFPLVSAGCCSYGAKIGAFDRAFTSCRERRSLNQQASKTRDLSLQMLSNSFRGNRASITEQALIFTQAPQRPTEPRNAPSQARMPE